MREVLEDIQIRVLRSYVKIPVIFLIPALILASLYVSVYFFLNSNYALLTVKQLLEDNLGAKIEAADLVVGPSLGNVNLYEVTLKDEFAESRGQMEPVVFVDRVQAKVGLLGLLTKNVHIKSARVKGAKVRMHFDDTGELNLLRALGLNEEEDPNAPSEGPPVSLDFEDIWIEDSSYSLKVEDVVHIQLPQVSMKRGGLFLDKKSLLIQVDSLKTGGTLTYPHTLFGFEPEKGPWVVNVSEFNVNSWRWVNDGFTAESIRAYVEGYTLEAKGRMTFPGTEEVLTYKGEGVMSIPLWSPLVEYFAQDNVQVEAPRVEIEGEGTLNWVKNKVQVFISLVQAAGLQAQDVEATVKWTDDLLEVENGSFRFYGGKANVEYGFFSLFRLVYGGIVSFEGFNPAAMLRDLQVDLPFLEGKSSGKVEAYGQVPKSQDYDPRSNRLLANVRDRWVTAKLLEPMVLERESRELFPAKKVTLLTDAEVWVDLDRVVMPKGTLMLDGEDKVKIKNLSLRYDTMEFEPYVGRWGLEIDAQVKDLGPYLDLYGVPDIWSEPARFTLLAKGPLLAPEAKLNVTSTAVMHRERTLLSKTQTSISLDRRGRVGINTSLQSSAGTTRIRGNLSALRLGQDPLNGRPVFTARKNIPLDLDVDAKGLDLGSGLLLAGVRNIPVSGKLDVEATVKGTSQSPSVCTQMRAFDLEVYQEPLTSVTFKGGYGKPGKKISCVPDPKKLGPNPHLWVEELELVHRNAGTLNAKGAFVPRGQKYSFVLGSREFRLGQLSSLGAQGVILSGAMDLSLYGTGSLREPDLSGSLRTDTLQVNGVELGKLSLAMHTINTKEEHTLYVAGSLLPWVSVEAEVPFDQDLPMGMRAPLYASVGFDSLDLFKLLKETQLWAKFEMLEGVQQAEKLDRALVSGKVEFFMPQTLTDYQVLATLPSLRLGPSRLRLSNKEEIRFGYITQGSKNGLLTIEHFDIGALDRHLKVQGSIDPQANLLDLEIGGALRLEMLETLSQIFAEGLLDEVLEATGEVEVDATLRGAVPNVEIEGGLKWKPSRLVLRSLEEAITIRRGALSINSTEIKIPKDAPLSGEVLGGVFTLSGEMGLVSLVPSSLSLDLWSHNIRYSVPEVANVTLDTKLNFKAGDITKFDTWVLSGAIDILDGLFYQSINVLEKAVTGRLVSLFNRRTEVYESGLLERYPELREVEFDVRLKARDGFKIKNLVERFTLDLEVRLDLAITQSLAVPRLAGNVEVLEGNVLFQGERFRVKTGLMRFNGDPARPFFDVVAIADIRNACRENALSNQFNSNLALNGAIVTGDEQDDEIYRISLNVQGYPDTLNILYESNPFANQRDILSLLFTGCTVDLLTASSASQPTLETLFGSFIGQLERQIQDAISVEEFNIVPGVERTQVRISDNLTRRLSWRFQLDKTFNELSGTGQYAQFEYQLTDRLKGLISESSFSDVNTSNRLQLDLKLKYRLPVD